MDGFSWTLGLVMDRRAWYATVGCKESDMTEATRLEPELMTEGKSGKDQSESRFSASRFYHKATN